jgi:hypothetical protein
MYKSKNFKEIMLNIINKFKKNFFNIEINDCKFKLAKNKLNHRTKSFYYYSEFKNLEKFKISNIPIKRIEIGLSFFVVNEKKVGICIFAKNQRKQTFILENIVKKNPNLNVNYYLIKNLKDSLIINCFFYGIDEKKENTSVKLIFN